MQHLLVLLTLLLIVCPSQAERFAPIIQPIGMAEKVVVRGFKGVLQIVPTDSETLKVEAEKKGAGAGWNFEVRKKQNYLEVRVKSPVDQEGWEKLRSKNGVPTFDMKITVPKRALEVYWNEGQVFSSELASDLSVQMTEGKMKFAKGKGNLRLQLIKGRIEVSEQEGNVALQTFKGEVLLQKNKGALSLNNHSSLYTVDGHEGPVEYRNHSGSTNFKGLKGVVNVKNVSGAVRLRDFEGSFDGDFSKGSLDAKVGNFQTFNVTSDDAAITLDVPKSSGAMVKIRSEKGRLWAPIHLQKLKKGRWTERRGRLKGKEAGDIKIISKYGDIVLK